MKKESRIDCPRCSGAGICCSINTMRGGPINQRDVIDCPLCFPPEPEPEPSDYPQDSTAAPSVFGDTCPRCGGQLEQHEGLERDYPSCPRCQAELA